MTEKLKTLNDLFHPLLKTIYFKPIKTEKEFTKWLNSYRKNKLKEIKQEAIKWVKEGRVSRESFMVFHNIKEEDLI